LASREPGLRLAAISINRTAYRNHRHLRRDHKQLRLRDFP
jgi:hypothetical protein